MRAPAARKEEQVGASSVVDFVDTGGAGVGQQLLKKGPWTAAEDAILKEYVRKHGEGNWNAVQKNSGLQRCGKSCRLRWANHLRPNLKKGSLSPEEEMLILQLHANFGNKWSYIANNLPGRTDNEIKNYWNTRIKRRKRAGLPLYPLEIQQQMALKGHRQGQAVPPFPNFPSSAQYGALVPPFQSPPSYLVKTKLPSSQFFSGTCGEQMAPLRQGNSGLLDALLQESHGVGDLLSSKCLYMDPFGKSDDSDCSIDDLLSLHILPNFYPTEPYNSFTLNGLTHLLPLPGIQVKQEAKETGIQDAFTLLDMIPEQTTPLTAVLSECNSPEQTTPLTTVLSECNSGREFSNGPSSVVTTDDDIGPVEPGWDFASFHWDNMPSIRGEFHCNEDFIIGT